MVISQIEAAIFCMWFDTDHNVQKLMYVTCGRHKRSSSL